MIRRHITPALFCFLLLIASCILQPQAAAFWKPLLAAAGALAAVAVPLGRTHGRRAAVLLFSAAAGLFLGSVSLARVAVADGGAWLPAAPSRITSFMAVVREDSTLSRTGKTVIRAALREAAASGSGIKGDARGGVLLFIAGDYRFSIGQVLQVAVALAPMPPGSTAQFSAFADRAAVRSLGFCRAAWRARADAREWIHRSFERAGYPVSALMEALLIGSREEVPAALSDSFLRTGSLHILALSGLHITVLYGILAFVLRFLRGRWLKFLIATVVLLFYQALAGFMPSLLRATVMIVVAGIAFCADRDAEPLNALSLAGIVLLLLDPLEARSASFQLSFLAMAGIFVFAPLVQAPLEGKLPRFVLVPFALSVGAQAATLPLVVTMFGAWYPSGLAAGLLLVPLTTGLLWAGLAWLPLSLLPWPVLLDACGAALRALYAVIDGVARFFAQAPGIVVTPSTAVWYAVPVVLVLAAASIVLPSARRARAARA